MKTNKKMIFNKFKQNNAYIEMKKTNKKAMELIEKHKENDIENKATWTYLYELVRNVDLKL